MWKPSGSQAPLIADYTKTTTDVITDTVVYITNFSRARVPKLSYQSIDDFIGGLSILPATLLSHLAGTVDIATVESLVHLRGSIESTTELLESLAMDFEQGTQIIKYLLQNAQNEIKATPEDVTACVAKDKANLGVMEAILRSRPQKIDISWKNDRGFTALMIAAKMGHLAVTKLLVTRGARLDDGYVSGTNAL
jgi:hypothetical protein